MKFNYSYEKRKFEAEWARLRDEYRAAGMDEAAIEAMREFDWGVFKSERTYRLHNQEFLAGLNDAFAIDAADVDPSRRDGWMDELDNKELWSAISRLSESDIELMTLYFFEDYTVTEIAKIQGVSHSAVSKKIIRIKNYLKKFAFGVTD